MKSGRHGDGRVFVSRIRREILSEIEPDIGYVKFIGTEGVKDEMTTQLDGRSKASSERIQIDMQRKKLLIVEDERNQGLLYEQELTAEGYQVTTACSGEEALELFRNDTFDLVVLDVGMPGMNGLETLARLLGLNSRIPVILNTAYPSYQDNFMSWAADAYVIKSMDLGELKDKIKESLHQRVISDR